MRVFVSIIRYAWAAPATVLGLLLALIVICFGADCRLVHGVIEIAGGRFFSLIPLLPRFFHIDAITFGHVIIGPDHALLALLRPHERIHVRQYERWGPLLIPLYVMSSLIQLLKGRDPYRFNRFEREAFAEGTIDIARKKGDAAV